MYFNGGCAVLKMYNFFGPPCKTRVTTSKYMGLKYEQASKTCKNLMTLNTDRQTYKKIEKKTSAGSKLH